MITAREILRYTLASSDLAALRRDVAEALANGGDLSRLVAEVSAAYPPTKDEPTEISAEEWESALRSL